MWTALTAVYFYYERLPLRDEALFNALACWLYVSTRTNIYNMLPSCTSKMCAIKSARPIPCTYWREQIFAQAPVYWTITTITTTTIWRRRGRAATSSARCCERVVNRDQRNNTMTRCSRNNNNVWLLWPQPCQRVRKLINNIMRNKLTRTMNA